MALEIKLQTMLYALEDYDDGEYGYYIDKETGAEYIIWDECVNDEEDDELYNKVVNDSERYIKLPDLEAVDTIERMEKFIATIVTDEKHKKILTKTIKKINRTGKKYLISAEVNKLGLLEEWNNFTDDYNERYARTWCAERNITLI